MPNELNQAIKNMKTKLSILFITFIFIMQSACSLRAQVTIGGGDKPEKGAFLDLKTYVPNASDGNNVSLMLCNIMAWALEQAQYFGINSSKYF